jgi:hypothetical protein
MAGRRLPPFGAELAARLEYNNPPSLAFVFCGRNAWTRARNPRVRIGDCVPLVWTGADPAGIRWPVRHCAVVIEVDHGPTVKQIRDLAVELLLSGADGVLAWWLAWSESRPIVWQADGSGHYLTAAEINEALWPVEHQNREARRHAV